jgi:glycosyl transferase family 25
VPPLEVDRVYIIHIRSGAEDRAASIERQLGRLGIEFEYVLDGDVDDLTPELLDRWFAGPMKQKHRNTSCCCKHLIAYSRILRDGWRDALVLEDDIFLPDDFVSGLNASLRELRARTDAGQDAAFISLENSGLKQVPEAAPGTTLYRRAQGRETGAYWLSRAAAERFLAVAEGEKVSLRTPLFHATVVQSGAVDLWWRHPAIAEQGSVNGKFDSMLDPKRTGVMRRPRWLARKSFQRWLRPVFDRLLGRTG